jgi:hypothetical protein
VDIWGLGLVFFQILFLLNFQALGTFLKRSGLLDPDIVLRRARVPNLVSVEIRAMMIERFRLPNSANQHQASPTKSPSDSIIGTSPTTSLLSGVHGEFMAVFDAMLQPEFSRCGADKILSNHTPPTWRREYELKKSRMKCDFVNFCFMFFF